VDPTVLIVVLLIGVPIATVWALAKSAQLRGPTVGKESRRPVGPLVTEVIPEEHPDDDADEDEAEERSGD
jgi:hypothetical protein